MAQDYHHGVRVVEVNEGNRTARFYEMQDAIKAASEQLPMETREE